jgi:hypothetical protein
MVLETKHHIQNKSIASTSLAAEFREAFAFQYLHTAFAQSVVFIKTK